MNATQYRIALDLIVVDLRREGVTAPIVKRLAAVVELPIRFARLNAEALFTGIQAGIA
jgi:hypothetical protein